MDTSGYFDIDVVKLNGTTEITVNPYSDNPVTIKLNPAEVLALIGRLANA